MIFVLKSQSQINFSLFWHQLLQLWCVRLSSNWNAV